MPQTTSTPADTSFATEVNQVIAQKAADIHTLSANASETFPHASLLGRIDSARNAYIGAVAAQAALRQMMVDDTRRSANLLDGATTNEDFHAIVRTLTAVRAAVSFFGGESAADAVDDVRRVALRCLEAQRATPRHS